METSALASGDEALGRGIVPRAAEGLQWAFVSTCAVLVCWILRLKHENDYSLRWPRSCDSAQYLPVEHILGHKLR